MYIRTQVETEPSWRGRLVSFFQYLTQAVVKVDRCAMVASLLASDPRKHDAFGNELLRNVSDVFGRQMEEDAGPVSKEDVAEVLRRRFFKPGSIRDPSLFRPHLTAAVGSIAALDEQTRKEQGAAEERYLSSYPFHPDLTEIFYTRWTQLDGFQRTRGILRAFAIALRDAEEWDTSPLIGPNVFLNEPGRNDLAEAASELASFASVDTETGKHQEWRPILEGELAKARTIQSEATGLRHREMEHQKLPGLWSAAEINVQDVYDFFAGGHTVSLPKEGYEDRLDIPKCESASVEAAISQAVERGFVWLTNGPASILGEPVPAGVLTATAMLRQPPDPVAVDELMLGSIPNAWKDGKTNALAIATARSTQRGMTLPWSTVRTAIDAGIRARWIELSGDSASWPCDLAGAQQVILQVPAGRGINVGEGKPDRSKPKGLLIAEAVLEANGIQDLADQIPDIAKAAVGNDLRFNVRVEFGGETSPDSEAVEEINKLLSEVSDKLRLN